MIHMPIIAAVASALLGGPENSLYPRYEGEINEEMRDFFYRLPDGSSIYITSKGGEEAIALDISDIIYRKNISINIDKYCLSSCAQYIMIASRKVAIRRGAFVSFHINSFAAIQAGLSVRDDIRQNADRARRLYQMRHVSLDLLGASLRGVGPICQRGVDQPGQTVVDSWVPSKRQLDRWGIKFSGYWPKNEKEVVLNSKNIFINGTKIRYEGMYKGDISMVNVCA